MHPKFAVALLPAITAATLAVSTEQASAQAEPSTTSTTRQAAEKPSLSTYTVRTGDTLSLIADQQLGDATRWQRVYEMNRKAVGPDPDSILPGQNLLLPTSFPTSSTGESEQKPRDRTPRHAKPQATHAQSGSGKWDRLAQCESSGNWGTNTGNGYYGGLQFSPDTWREYGGTGMPQNASREEQIRIAEKALAGQGPGAWPVCSYEAGMR
ncbi:transglycosylase family protein [Streptomyces sp. NPDC020379]|uniref:transglycosylase family protein n=1 Tax=Streptomyces sp. NPDC020379 TaxID=3365071 RepID=UPI0037A09C25